MIDIPAEIPDDGLNDIPADKHEDVLVANVAKGDGTSELVDEAHAVDNETRKSKALGTGGGLECLGGDGTLQRGIGERVDDVEEEVRGERTLAVGQEPGEDVAVAVLVPVDNSRETRVGGQAERAHEGTDDEHLAAGHPVGQRHGSQGADARQDLVEDVVGELLLHGGDAKAIENNGVEVAETVARELTEDGDHEHLRQTPAAAVREQERAVVPPDLVDAVGADTGAHLLDLEADKGRVGVAVAVVLDEKREGLVLTAVGHVPAGRLRDEEDATHDDQAGEGLEDQRQAPAVVALDEVAAIGDDGSRDGTTEPTAVVKAGAAATPVRGSNLDSVRGSGNRHDGDTQAKNETTDDDLSERVRGRDDDHADDNDDSTCEHGLPPAVVIRDDSGKGSANHGTNRVEREDDRDLRAGGANRDNLLEGRHGDDRSHEGAIVTVGAGTAEGDKDGDYSKQLVLETLGRRWSGLVSSQ